MSIFVLTCVSHRSGDLQEVSNETIGDCWNGNFYRLNDLTHTKTTVTKTERTLYTLFELKITHLI